MVLAAIGTVTGIVQSLIGFALVHGADTSPTGIQRISPAAMSFFIGWVVVFGVVLITAVGLLKRKEWARRLFIGLLGVGILWSVAVLIFNAGAFQLSFETPADIAAEVRARHEAVVAIVSALFVLMTIGVVLLSGWIIKRLTSSAITKEFHGGRK